MHELDNVIFKALNSTQERFSKGDGTARKYLPEVGPLGGFSGDAETGLQSLERLLEPGEPVALFLPEPVTPPTNWKIIRQCGVVEMVHDGRKLELPPNEYAELGEADVPEMKALTKLTEPGPFERRTRELGKYIGIRVDGQLASMAGERLRLPGFTEVSAVCTHPDHLGHGYAGALMTVLLEDIRNRGEIGILHALPENTRAIQLYERLGFKTRAELHLLVIAR
jgi:GNAT superfamily N-acetyltransferase